MLRPLAEGCHEHAEDILRGLPEKSHVGLHKLSIDSIPTIGDARPLAEDEIQALRYSAREQGHHLLDYFGCLFRSNLGIPFFRFLSAARLPDSSCFACKNITVCKEAGDRIDLAGIHRAASEAGIVVDQMVRENSVINLISKTAAARADEIYLSERSCSEVFISSISRADEPVLRELPDEIMSRWDATGLIDAHCLKAWAHSIEKLLS
jgi:hypothetical protein